jgi:hypothetical protein
MQSILELTTECRPNMAPLIDLFSSSCHNEIMKFYSFSVIYICLLLAGCASLPQKDARPDVVVKKKTEVKSVPSVQSGAVWELIDSDKVTLQLKNIDNSTNLSVILDRGINHRVIPAGHWELRGFERKGKSFQSMNTSKKFVFKIGRKENVYVGSVTIGCPKLSSLKPLIKMKFFNRYPFSSTTGLCEMVIGDNFQSVQKELRKSRKNNDLNLQMGL